MCHKHNYTGKQANLDYLVIVINLNHFSITSIEIETFRTLLFWVLSTHLFYIAMCRLGLLHVGHSRARQARSPKYLRHTIGTRTLLSQLVTDRGLPYMGGQNSLALS